LETVTSAAAERNKQPIAEQLLTLLPAHGKVLEIASGSGQHTAYFAAAMPGIHWQPTEPLESSLASIRARQAASAMANVGTPRRLDVLDADWRQPCDFDAVLCINMIHISPWETTAALFAGAARHLKAQGAGLAVLYGPFRENGQHTAPSNEAFEGWLRSLDPRYGVRNLEDVESTARAAGFERASLVRMPANNLLLAFRRRG
jgi:cyclopropane fatty-acyl-phospholipid synthase-like methyltransferase